MSLPIHRDPEYVAAVKLSATDPLRALRMLGTLRTQLWRQGARSEAYDVATMALIVAGATGQDAERVRLARWLVARVPRSDTFLIAGDTFAELGRREDAQVAWRQAYRRGRREGRIEVAEVAESRLLGTESEAEEPHPHEAALAQSTNEPELAVDLLGRRRRRLLRRGGWRDAAVVLEVCATIRERNGERGRAKALLRKAAEESPCARVLRRLAELELTDGRIASAQRYARRARRLALREGSRTDLAAAEAILAAKDP